tara:strand:+ start:13051 stop:15099 length:2049 start_codon:yes stop_codon:yes gene_type:complete
MILKRIALNNIRSYEDIDIEFSEGSTLLWGDIGSGKTSILLGIEFALFGLQPGQKGSSLLRNGAESGGATIEFEVEGKTALIERTLKRSKTISQDYSSITIDGKKKEIAVTELKSAVLDLLNYPKEFSKKQNLLYKFTVYTPQEEMKQIILQDANSRLNTLRHVFGVDKYKKVLENVAIVSSKIKDQKKLKEGMTFNLEKDKEDLEVKKKEIQAKNNELSSLEAELLLKVEARKLIETEKQGIDEKIKEKDNLQKEIEKTQILVTTKEQSIIENKNTLDQLKSQLEESAHLEFNPSKITDLESQISKTKEQKDALNEKNLEINSTIHSLMSKNEESETLKNNLSKIEMCPTCLQDVDPVYKSNVSNKLESDVSGNVNRIKELTIEKQDLNKKMALLDEEILSSQKQINDLNILKIRLQGVQEKRVRLEELQKQMDLSKKDEELLKGQIEVLRNSVFELAKFDGIFKKKQEELQIAQREEKISEIKLAELKREINVFLIQISELGQRIQKTEEIKKELNYLNELESWLTKKFSLIVSDIEKNVMVRLKSEFSEVFSKWFSMLVSDNFNVRLSDDFTPIIEQQDYEIDYSYLSGGERTAVALAYRLALNQVINSLLSKIKTRDLVILDEPTDGFSDSQLDKMREVLEQLEVAQLIVVSHEQKIEGFVENVVKFRKENGVSIKDS